jgi:hypothetical protein
MQATTVAPATREDDSNIMTAHNSRNASKSRNESDNRTANTVWMTAKAGMMLNSEMTAAAAGTTASSWMSSAVEPPKQTAETGATFSRDTSNSSRNSQREHKATAAEAI